MKRIIMAAALILVFYGDLHAQTLRSYLPGLPQYFTKKYGNILLTQKSSLKVSQAQMKLVYKNLAVGGPKSQASIKVPDYFLIELPQGHALSYLDISRSFLSLMAREDQNFSFHIQSLEKLGYQDQQNRIYKSSQFVEKIMSYGSYVLLGKNPSAENFVKLWWELKFSPENQKANLRPKKGDPILFAIRQYGYFEPSTSWATNIRRRLDFGHAALGIRWVGGNPENDLYINPGSKDFDLNEVTLPTEQNPEVMNSVAVWPLWKWAEIQIYHRYMQISTRVLALNPLQTKALKILLPQVRGIGFGPAIVIQNDCVDGSSKIGTFLLPIEKSVNPEIIAGLAFPKGYQAQMAKNFKDLLGDWYYFPNVRGQNPQEYTPGIGMSVEVGPLSRAKTYQNYLQIEEKIVSP